MNAVKRLPIVGVIGSGTESHAERAEAVGRWLAAEGVHLLTGAGGGVMEAVSRAFAQTPGRKGLVLGIVPSAADNPLSGPRPGYPNEWVEVPIYTHLPLSGTRGQEPMSRNHINVLSSTVLIALSGGAGTASEVALALRYGRPLVAYLDRREDIVGLAASVVVESEFERMQQFVRSLLQVEREK